MSNPALSHRQRQVLELAGEGLTNRQISEKLGIAEGTVSTHMDHVFSKLHVHKRTSAVLALVADEPNPGPVRTERQGEPRVGTAGWSPDDAAEPSQIVVLPERKPDPRDAEIARLRLQNAELRRLVTYYARLAWRVRRRAEGRHPQDVSPKNS